MKLDSNSRYEIKAMCFYRMTRHMAPGKDPSPACYPAPFEERQAAWDEWMKAHGEVVNAMLYAVEQILTDEDDDT